MKNNRLKRGGRLLKEVCLEKMNLLATLGWPIKFLIIFKQMEKWKKLSCKIKGENTEKKTKQKLYNQYLIQTLQSKNNYYIN